MTRVALRLALPSVATASALTLGLQFMAGHAAGDQVLQLILPTLGTVDDVVGVQRARTWLANEPAVNARPVIPLEALLLQHLRNRAAAAVFVPGHAQGW